MVMALFTSNVSFGMFLLVLHLSSTVTAGPTALQVWEVIFISEKFDVMVNGFPALYASSSSSVAMSAPPRLGIADYGFEVPDRYGLVICN